MGTRSDEKASHKLIISLTEKVLEALKPGIYEYEIKAVFDYHQIRNGLLNDAYNGIHASGPNSAILHYTDNNRKMIDGDLFLIDAGYEYNGYASDFTRTYPVNGKFSGDQASDIPDCTQCS
jgi:Xaa-Pro dipeptidase